VVAMLRVLLAWVFNSCSETCSAGPGSLIDFVLSPDFASVYEDKWLYFPSGLSSSFVQPLTEVELRVLAKVSGKNAHLVKFYKDGEQFVPADVAGTARHYLSEGVMVVINSMETADPATDHFAKELSKTLGLQIEVNLYATPPQTVGIDAHHDRMDVIILQISGTKRWLICDPIGAARDLPVRSSDTPGHALYNRYQLESLDYSGCKNVTMFTGDLLYLPRGTIHAPATEDSASVHLTVGLLSAYTWQDVAQALLMTQSINRNLYQKLVSCLSQRNLNKLVNSSVVVEDEFTLLGAFLQLPFASDCAKALAKLRSCKHCSNSTAALMLDVKRKRDAESPSAKFSV